MNIECSFNLGRLATGLRFLFNYGDITENDLDFVVNPFMLLVSFYISWKHLKMKGCLIF